MYSLTLCLRIRNPTYRCIASAGILQKRLTRTKLSVNQSLFVICSRFYCVKDVSQINFEVLYKQLFDRHEKFVKEIGHELGELSEELKLTRQQLIEVNGVRFLRTHIEIIEGLFLAIHPIPSSVQDYKILCERKKHLEENDDIILAIDNRLDAHIKWPAYMDVELKDAMNNKINKHFRNWVWLLYIVDAPEIKGIRSSVGDDVKAMRSIASGIAGLYIYSSLEICKLEKYSKKEMEEIAVPAIGVPLIRSAARIILRNMWVD